MFSMGLKELFVIFAKNLWVHGGNLEKSSIRKQGLIHIWDDPQGMGINESCFGCLAKQNAILPWSEQMEQDLYQIAFDWGFSLFEYIELANPETHPLGRNLHEYYIGNLELQSTQETHLVFLPILGG